MRLPKLRGGGVPPVAAAAPVSSPPPAVCAAAGEGSSNKPPEGGGRVVSAGIRAPEDDRPGRCPSTGPATQTPVAPHAAQPVGATGHQAPAVPARDRHGPELAFDLLGAADGRSCRWAGAVGPVQPGAREYGRSVRDEGSAGTHQNARPVQATAAFGEGAYPSERAGADAGRRGWNRAETCEVPGDAPAPPNDYEPWWFCPTCSDGHIGPCDAGTPRRRSFTWRLLDLIGRPA